MNFLKPYSIIFYKFSFVKINHHELGKTLHKYMHKTNLTLSDYFLQNKKETGLNYFDKSLKDV